MAQPDSFTETVENIFDLSFLVKKGSAGLSVNTEGDLVVKHTGILHDQGQGAAAGGEVEAVDPTAKQCVLSFSMKDWRAIKEAYEIEGGMLPRRGEEEKMQK